MKIKNNILIITSMTVDRSGIEAIKKQFEKNYPSFNVIVIDENQYGAEKSASRQTKYRERLMQSIPTLYRRVKSIKGAKFVNRTKQNFDKRRAMSKKLSGRTRCIYNAIIRFSPSVIIVTTPKLMSEATYAKKRTHFKYPVVGLIERYTLDRSFFNISADGYIVENADTKNQLTAMGYPAQRVHVLGFPIEEKQPDVDFVFKEKEHLGLNLNPTVYLSGGAIGSKELYPVFELLLDQGDIINIIVNCGRNESLYMQMLREAERKEAQNVKVYLATDNDFEDNLTATDCIITIYDSALIYRAFLLGIPVIAYAPDNQLERNDLTYLKDKNLLYFAEDYNHVIIGMYDVIQSDVGKELSSNAFQRTRATSLSDIAVFLSTFSDTKGK